MTPDVNLLLKVLQETSPVVQAGGRSPMPFPDNRNPNTDFVNRWPQGLPPTGILNDLKPPAETTPPLMRKLYGG